MPVETRLPDVSVPDAQPLTLQGYTYKVYKQHDIQILADKLKKNPDQSFVIFAMTPEGYRRVESNYSELQRYIAEQKAIIVYLKQTISERSAPIPETK